jgi:hypothetical protein
MEMNGILQNGNRFFFGGSGNRNGRTFFGGTDAETEFLFPTDTEVPFYSGFAWLI